MGYPIGLAPDGSGNGTKPVDMQRWIWSLYRVDTAQIARGLEVSGRSNMTYAFNSGVIIIPTGAQRAIAVPVDGGTVPTAAAPSSGTRTDYIYVGQDGAVKVGTSQPEDTALLDKRTVPAGITATTATTSLLGNRKYAPLFGSSMGRLAYWSQSDADLTKQTDARKRMCALTFTIDSDRRVDMGLQVSYEMARNANSGPDVGKTASFLWEIWIDGVHRRSVEIAVESFADTKQNRVTWDMLAGTHTVELYRTRRLIGTSDPTNDFPVYRHGGAHKWPATSLTIVDIGGIE